jgi:tRNA-specific 2-thiouridylase
VRVGPRGSLERTSLSASGVNWTAGAPPAGPIAVTAQIRYRHAAAPARVEDAGDRRVSLVFDAPQPAITPGQAAVWYDGDEVLGGGWID